MPIITRVSDKPYRWRIGEAPLSRIANREKMLPRRFISKDGFAITEAARRYLQPLIRGEDYPPYINGLPNYVSLKGAPVAPRLKKTFVV
jgi:6-phosphofructokinase 1